MRTRGFLLDSPRSLRHSGVAVTPPPVQTFSDSIFDGLLEPASLTFWQTGGDFIIDPDTGVEIHSNSAVVITAFLQEDQKPVGEDMPGPNSSSVYLSGYCMDPVILPSGIGAGAIADYVFTPEYGSNTRGKFFLARKPASPFGIVQEIVGDEIEGWLVIDAGA